MSTYLDALRVRIIVERVQCPNMFIYLSELPVRGARLHSIATSRWPILGPVRERLKKITSPRRKESQHGACYRIG